MSEILLNILFKDIFSKKKKKIEKVLCTKIIIVK